MNKPKKSLLELRTGKLSEKEVMERVAKRQRNISTGMDLRKYGYFIFDTRDYVLFWRRSDYCRKISYGLSVDFDWHHVNDTDMVAVPREIHRMYPHSAKKGNLMQMEGVLG